MLPRPLPGATRARLSLLALRPPCCRRCVDGIVELNTLFLIARRCAPWRPVRTLCSWLYWGSFIPLRCILYPLVSDRDSWAPPRSRGAA